jgi:CheY-like chemotaxis protein
MEALRKILVVDDDPVVGKSIDRVLAKKGYAVITAQNGEEALHKLGHEKYDLVFTDIKMPGMSGLEVAERVKASQPWLPVVVVTGYGTDDYEARAAAAGVSGFLHKPLSPEMIEGSTDKALSEQKAAAPAPMKTEAVEAAPSMPESSLGAMGTAIKNVALFLASPFIGLAYIVAMPFVGLGALAWLGAKALAQKAPVTKQIAKIAVAPFAGLAFILAAPFVGLAMLAWYGAKAMMKQA